MNIHCLWKMRNLFLRLITKLSILDSANSYVNRLHKWINRFTSSIKSHCKTEGNSYARKQGHIYSYVKCSFTLEGGDNCARSFPFWLSRNYSTRSHSNLSAKNTLAFVTSDSILQLHVKESRDNFTFAWKSYIADKSIDTPNACTILSDFWDFLKK